MHPTLRSIRRLTKRERKRFVSWLESGLYHSRSQLTTLGSWLRDDPYLTEAALRERWQAFPTGKARVSQQLTHLGSALELFLGLECALESPWAVQRYVALALENKQAHRRAIKARKKAHKALTSERVNPQDRLLFHFLLQRDQLESNDPGQEITPAEILPVSHTVDQLFIFYKLQQACRLAAYGNLHNTPTDLPLLEGLLREIEAAPDLLSTPELQLLHAAYLTLSEREQGARQRLTTLMFNQLDFLRFPAGRELFVVLLNHGVSQLNKGRNEFLSTNLDLYEIGLKSQLLLVDQQLTGMTFYNIFFLAVKLDRLHWAGDFLQAYMDKLSAQDRQQIYPYCLANWHYERKELDKAGDLLVNYEASGSQSMQLQARITLVKIYYDQQNFELLESLLNSITVFISRNNRIGYHGDIYLSFVRLARKLMRLPPEVSPQQLSALETEIGQLPVKSLSDWLRVRLESHFTS